MREGFEMEKTIVSLIVMIISSCMGMFVGGLFNNTIGGMILFVLVSGIACIIHSLEKIGK